MFVITMQSAATKLGATNVNAKSDIAAMDSSAMMSMNVPLTMTVTRMPYVITQMAVLHVNVTKGTMVMESYVMI